MNLRSLVVPISLFRAAICCAVSLWFSYNTSTAAPVVEILPSIEMDLKAAGGGKMKLIIRNGEVVPVSLGIDVADLEHSRFLGFPVAAAFQLRNREMKVIEMKSHGTGWFYPVILSSVIDQPVFVTKDHKNAPEMRVDQPLHMTTLAGHEAQVITFDCQRALFVSRTSVVRGEPTQFRVKIDVAVESGGKRSKRPVISDWMELP